ncbi:MAG TPA: pilus assembly protein TadB [Planctomycetes bacterium]|nr:pilus assembly protein TadB [Fuerstiella sp.]HIK91590.1 pilus assembly protein TadB [Planctomycetota bacterium]
MAVRAEALPVVPSSGFDGILKEDVRFSTGNSNGVGDAVNGWFDRLMLQSGIKTPPAVWLMLCLLVGVAIGGIIFVVTENMLLTAAAFFFGLAIPIVVVMFQRTKRQKLIMEQLPGMADALARAARTGRNVDHSFRAVAADTPAPLGDELRLVVRRTELGMDLGTAVRDLTDRTGVSTLTMFSSAVGVHQDTGGDLILVLERLATAVRDRLHFVNRMRAATVASRLGTILMLVVPPLVVLFFTWNRENYIADLFGSFWGGLSLGLAIALQIIGGLIVVRIFKRSARF